MSANYLPSLAGIKDRDSVHLSVLTKANVRALERKFGKDDMTSKIEESRNSFRLVRPDRSVNGLENRTLTKHMG